MATQFPEFVASDNLVRAGLNSQVFVDLPRPQHKSIDRRRKETMAYNHPRLIGAEINLKIEHVGERWSASPSLIRQIHDHAGLTSLAGDLRNPTRVCPKTCKIVI